MLKECMIFGAILLIVTAVFIEIKWYFRIPVIDFRYSYLGWGLYCAMISVGIAILSLVCLLITFYVEKKFAQGSTIYELFALDVFLLLCVFLLMKYVGRGIELFDFDVHKYYDVSIVKAVVAIMSMACGLAILKPCIPMVFRGEIWGENKVYLSVANAFIFFSGELYWDVLKDCKGRYKKYSVQYVATMTNHEKYEKNVYYIKMISPAVFIGVLMYLVLSDDNYRFMQSVRPFYISVVIFFWTMGITGLVCNIITNPSEVASRRRLEKAMLKAQHGKNAVAYYRGVRYSLKSNLLIIHSMRVEYPGHESELANVFGIRTKAIDGMVLDEIEHILSDVAQQRRDYFRDGYAACRWEAREKLAREKISDF